MLNLFIFHFEMFEMSNLILLFVRQIIQIIFDGEPKDK